MKKNTKKLKTYIRAVVDAIVSQRHQLDIAIHSEYRTRQMTHPNAFCRYGAAGYSQADEDGLTIEILTRLGLQKGTFCEFGVGDGTENNTLILLAMGWQGFWLGGQEIAFDSSKTTRLSFTKAWITKSNIIKLLRDGLATYRCENVDVISLDLDGNDIYLVEKILQNKITPRLFIVEYNANFLPPVKFQINYNDSHVWQGDDYFGASLTSFEEVFSNHGYRLVCCNAATGTNAFFVKKEDFGLFPEVPRDLSQIYSSPFTRLPKRTGHRKSVKSIEEIVC